MKKLKAVLALLFVFWGFGQLNAQVVVVKPERPKVVVVKPKAPAKNHIWVEGDWVWSPKQKAYVWKKGRWIKHPKGKKYVPGHWKKVRGGWKWIPGHFKRGRR